MERLPYKSMNPTPNKPGTSAPQLQCCPFCGNEAKKQHNGFIYCDFVECGNYYSMYSERDWQRIPRGQHLATLAEENKQLAEERQTLEDALNDVVFDSFYGESSGYYHLAPSTLNRIKALLSTHAREADGKERE